MKKLLSLLSVLTISGTAVPTTIAASPYHKQINNSENLIRNKRENNTNDEFITIHEGRKNRKNYLLLTPDTFEEISHIFYSSNSQRNFANNFKIKINEKIPRTRDIQSTIKSIGESVWTYWDKIFNVYENSNKNKKIKISFNETEISASLKDTYLDSEIIYNDNLTYLNSYFEKLNRDFNNELNHEKINLEIINDNKNNFIFNKIKKIFPNLDISQIEIDNKKEYSYFSEGFLIELKVKKTSEIYSIGKIKTKFTFNTNVNINKINERIENDPKVKTWINHLNNWQSNVDRQIKEDLPNFSDSQKRTWKDNVAEQMKTYIRDWDYVITLIEYELKLEELNNEINGIKKDIDDLKLEINKINETINAITNNTSDEEKWCNNITSVGGTLSNFIPVIGSVSSAIFGAASKLCSIQKY